MKWHTESRRANSLIPYEHNPRRLTEKQASDLKASLEKFDLVEIPAINTNGTLLAGHQRVKILQLLGRGEEEIDVRVPDRLLTEDEVKEYNVRSNKNTGEWDFSILANAFEVDDLLKWGFDEKELQIDHEVKEDDFDVEAAMPQEPISKLGEVYQIGRHRLMCGDATKREDVERLMEGQKAAMVFTDPPYNVAYIGKTKDALTIQNDSMSEDSFADFITKSMENLLAVCTGALYICMSSSEWGTVQNAFKNLGGHWSRVIVWVKDRMVLSRADYHTQFEPIAVVNDWEQEEGNLILYGWKEGQKRAWNGGRKQTDIWRFDRPTSSREHPTMKPVSLVGRAIKNSSNQGQVILDLFGGSGSTLIAAEQTG